VGTRSGWSEPADDPNQTATKNEPVRLELTSFDPHDPELIRQAQANGGVAIVKGKAIWQSLRMDDNRLVREGFETRAGFFTGTKSGLQN
jgi:hypothetical protein